MCDGLKSSKKKQYKIEFIHKKSASFTLNDTLQCASCQRKENSICNSNSTMWKEKFGGNTILNTAGDMTWHTLAHICCILYKSGIILVWCIWFFFVGLSCRVFGLYASSGFKQSDKFLCFRRISNFHRFEFHFKSVHFINSKLEFRSSIRHSLKLFVFARCHLCNV